MQLQCNCSSSKGCQEATLNIFDEARGQRHVRRVMVFMSKDNPLWDLLATFEKLAGKLVPTERLSIKPGSGSVAGKVTSEKFDLLGVSRTYFEKWRDGHLDDVASAFRQVRNLKMAIEIVRVAAPERSNEAMDLTQRIDSFLRSAEQDEPVRDSGLALGYRSANAVRMALDKAFHRRYPMFKKPFLESAETATMELAQIQGQHLAWMRRGRDLFLQCAMEFRYAVELPQGHVIRVKLDVPLIHGKPGGQPTSKGAHTPYDGWVMLSQNSRVFLTFETRHDDSRSDCIFMIIDNWPAEGGWRGGTYLTADQGNARGPASDLVLLRQVADDETYELKVIRRGQSGFDDLETRTSGPTSH